MNQSTDLPSPNVTRKMILGGYGFFLSSVLLDAVMDFFELEGGIENFLRGLEIVIFVLGTAGFIYIWRLLAHKDESTRLIHELNRNIHQHVEAGIAVRREFQVYVSEQFHQWGFTDSEKDIAFFMLKGLTFKEIATIRNVAERTIRNQSISIYSKSKLSGKHELAAYFLEEMFGLDQPNPVKS